MTEAAVRPDRRKNGDRSYRLLLRIVRVVLKLTTRREHVGLANIPKGSVIVVGNHISMADAFVLTTAVAKGGRRARMLATAGVFKIPVLGLLLKRFGFVPVQRRSATAAAALQPALQALADGECVGLYPEGEITRHPDMWPARAKSGVVRLALASGAPIVPVVQWGTHRVVGAEGTRSLWWTFPALRPRIEVVAGRPFHLHERLGVEVGAEPDAELLKAGADLVMDEICTLLETLRGEDRPPHAGKEANPPRIEKKSSSEGAPGGEQVQRTAA